MEYKSNFFKKDFDLFWVLDSSEKGVMFYAMFSLF